MSRDPERAQGPTNRISHDLNELRFKVNLGTLNEQLLTLIQLLNQLVLKARHVIPQLRILALSRHSQDAHPVMMREPLEPCQQAKTGLRDFRPTLGDIYRVPPD